MDELEAVAPVAAAGVINGGRIDVDAGDRICGIGQDAAAVAFAAGAVEYFQTVNQALCPSVTVPVLVEDFAHAFGRETLSGEFQCRRRLVLFAGGHRAVLPDEVIGARKATGSRGWTRMNADRIRKQGAGH